MRIITKHLTKIGLIAALVSATVFAERSDIPRLVRDLSQDTMDGNQVMDANGQLTQARKYKSRIELLKNAVSALAKKAEADKDVIKLGCINEKLADIGTAGTLADTLIGTISSKMSDADKTERDNAFAQITTDAYQKAITLAQEAEECVGEELSFVGKQIVEVTEDDLPATDDDPSGRPWWFPRPPTTSPHK